MRWGLAVVLLLTAIASQSARSSPADPPARYLATPRYVLELPPSPTDDDVACATKVLAVLETLASRLDREFVTAGVLKEADLPRTDAVKTYDTKGPDRIAEPPRRPVRWKVVFARTRAEIEAPCAALPATVNSKGTAFYAQDKDSFLGVVADDAETPNLLGWGTSQIVHHRAGMWFHRPVRPKGACVPLGFSHFMRWSHLGDEGALPAELGGIQKSYADPFRRRAAGSGDEFPSLDTLFAKTPKEFDDDPSGSYGPAVLFVEFLWDTSEATRKALLRSLRTYGVSGRPVAEFPRSVIATELRAVFPNDKALETAFRSFVATKSAEVNERKSAAK